jgi:arylsulfatase A-like enzyme
MVLLPTLCGIAGAEVQAERKIDGIDWAPLIEGDDTFAGRETFFYFSGSALNAVRKGDWKLHRNQGNPYAPVPGVPVQELYNLKADVGETTNCAAKHPEIVAELEAELQRMQGEHGDRYLGRIGSENRPIGRVENPQPLTEYDAEHPYMVAMYDLPDMPTMCG